MSSVKAISATNSVEVSLFDIYTITYFLASSSMLEEHLEIMSEAALRNTLDRSVLQRTGNITVAKDENYLSVGDTFDGPVVAQYDDGVPEPAEG